MLNDMDAILEEIGRRILSGKAGKLPQGSESTQCSIGTCTSTPGPYVDYMGSSGEMIRHKFCQDHYELWSKYMRLFQKKALEPSSVLD